MDQMIFVRKFLKKLALLSLPFIFILGIEQFVLPSNFFTFRVWEAATVKSLLPLFPGSFYPNQNLSMIEEGDLGHHTPKAVKRTADWSIDSFGFRNSKSNCDFFPLVLVGDSTAVGTGVTQDQTLANRLISKNICSYSFATGSLTEFLRDYPKMYSQPKIVIMPRIERALSYLEKLEEKNFKDSTLRSLAWKLRSNDTFQFISKILDRSINSNMLYYIKNRLLTSNIKNTLQSEKQKEATRSNYEKLSFEEKVMFIEGDSANADRSDEEIQKIADTLEGYQVTLKARGMHFIFMPVPNKETILYFLLPSKKPSNFLPRLFSELSKRNVDYIDLVPSFSEIVKNGKMPYQFDDTHWSADGIEAASGLIEMKVSRLLRNEKENN
jgi:alginate O-acetyltransferase complex protein AlgJ